MKMLSFLGETPTIALRNAQKECGEDAIVISTKKISDQSSDSVNMYEVMVAIDYDEKDEEKLKIPVQKIETPKIKDPTPAESSESKEKFSANFYDFKSEIMRMQEAIMQVQKTLWDPKSQLFDLTIPPEFIDIYALFEQNEFDQEMTYTILKKTIAQLPIAFKEHPAKVNDFFKLVIRRLIPIKHEQMLKAHQRKIVMLVGPTGVGKTTSIAKLAARYAYKVGSNYTVGVITLDSFRVGAIEQLKAYTNIMRLPLEVVKKPEELVEAIIRLKDCNYIFIDTAGSSQYDIDKIELINEHLVKVDEIPIEKTLVLPANVKQTDLQEIYANYAKLNINNLLFTKLDETRSFGNLISFSHKIKKSICYFSVGQNVPDDLLVANPNYLIECFMNRKCGAR